MIRADRLPLRDGVRVSGRGVQRWHMHGSVTRWSWSMLSRAAAQEQSLGAAAKERETTNLDCDYTHTVSRFIYLQFKCSPYQSA